MYTSSFNDEVDNHDRIRHFIFFLEVADDWLDVFRINKPENKKINK
jgi:hypothetical protein